jgi:hypothetical protein
MHCHRPNRLPSSLRMTPLHPIAHACPPPPHLRDLLRLRLEGLPHVGRLAKLDLGELESYLERGDRDVLHGHREHLVPVERRRRCWCATEKHRAGERGIVGGLAGGSAGSIRFARARRDLADNGLAALLRAADQHG